MPYEVIASAPDTEKKTVIRRVETLLLKGPAGLKSRKPPGRKPLLTKSQKKELNAIISRGPAKAGFPGNCRRSPMIRHLIYERFGIFYAVNHISGLLENMGFSYRKACSVSSRRDRNARREWLKTVCPEILKTAGQKNALILSGTRLLFRSGEHGRKKGVSLL